MVSTEGSTPTNKEKASGSVVIQMTLDRVDRIENLIEKVAESQTETNTNFIAFLEKFKRTEDRVDDSEAAIKAMGSRVSRLEKMNIRFVAYIVSGFLIVGTLASIGSWWYLNVYKPQQQTTLTTKSALDSIDALNVTNQKILEALN